MRDWLEQVVTVEQWRQTIENIAAGGGQLLSLWASRDADNADLVRAAFAGDDNMSSTDKVSKMDLDGDSRLSLSEFTAGGHKTADDFAKYDVNGDGYVTDEEIDVGKERGMTPGEKKDVRAKGRPVPTTNPKSPEPATTTEP